MIINKKIEKKVNVTIDTNSKVTVTNKQNSKNSFIVIYNGNKFHQATQIEFSRKIGHIHTM